MAATLRTPETEQRYKEFKDTGVMQKVCRLCEMLEEAPDSPNFTHWKIVKNEFPYDLIAKKHDMLVSKRHVNDLELSGEEREEYNKIKHEYLNLHYTYLLESTPHNPNHSIPAHFHIQLLSIKDGPICG